MKITIVTSTRADWGLLSPIAKRLSQMPEVELSIIATNMHLDPLRGMTINEIIDDGFTVNYQVEMTPASDSGYDTAEAMAKCLSGMAKAYNASKPDLILLLGDRFEMLAVASAATVMGIPIAHISGGEITEGAIDDNIRHAISKLASLHFATTETHRQRLIAMGERPERVINTGALGVYNIKNLKLMSKLELEQSISFNIENPTLLVTFHVATNDAVAPTERFAELLTAIERVKCNCIFTYPNNDPGSGELINMINQFADKHSERIHVIPSLGKLRYLSSLQYVDAVVGNSSSGIVEVPSAHIPTLDIGCRQQGRTASKSVIHCADDAASIEQAIRFALSDEGKTLAQTSANEYEKENTLDLIIEALTACDATTLLPKKFYNIKL